MKLLDQFSIREAETLSMEDRDRLESIRIPHSAGWADFLAHQVETAEAKLSQVMFAGRPVGTILWRIESDVERELVVMSVASEPGYLVRHFLAQAIDSIAAANKCESARFNTIRPGLVKFAQLHGWHTSEIVMRKSYHGA